MDSLQQAMGSGANNEFGEDADDAIISAICWVPKGSFKLQPKTYSEAEMKAMYEEFQKQELEQSKNALSNLAAVEQEGNDDENPELEEDDDDEDEDDEEMAEKGGKRGRETVSFQKEYMKAMIGSGVDMYYGGKEDPLLKDKPDSDSEEEDNQFQPDDEVALAIYNEESVSSLNVYVYEPKEHNFFLHHDFLLTNHGLCVEWLNFTPGQPTLNNPTSNLCAVGTMDPFIELWDLDVVDPVGPIAVLGDPELAEQEQQQTKKNKKNKKAPPKKAPTNTHTGPVLSLSWNKLAKQFLASGSDDTTVRVWDLERTTSICTLTHHKKTVHNVQWHPKKNNMLLSGSFDRRCCLLDPRQPNNLVSINLRNSDLSAMNWHPTDDNVFMAGFDDGYLCLYDVRKPAAAPFISFEAHKGAVTDAAFYSAMPNIFVTCSEDKSSRVWRVEANNTVQMVKNDSHKGVMFAMGIQQNFIALGGEKGRIKIENMNEYVVQPKKQFSHEAQQQQQK